MSDTKKPTQGTINMNDYRYYQRIPNGTLSIPNGRNVLMVEIELDGEKHPSSTGRSDVLFTTGAPVAIPLPTGGIVKLNATAFVVRPKSEQAKA